MEFENKTVLITGGAHGIGLCTRKMFEAQGAHVCIIDIRENDYFTGDVAGPDTLKRFVEKAVSDYQKIDILVNNAIPLMKGIDTCSYDEFLRAVQVGAAAPFYLSKLCAPYMPAGSSIINITSTRDAMSEAQTESYSAAKGALLSLTHAMAVSFGGKIRVNAVAPGWIETNDRIWEGADALQHPAKRVGRPEDIASMILYLASDKASFITGQEFVIDGGMTKQMIYHGDGGWTYQQ